MKTTYLFSFFILLNIFFSSTNATAQGSKFGFSPAKRQNERDNERWSLSTFLFERNKLKSSDLWIRFFTNGNDSKNYPRLEPFAYGLWYNGFDNNNPYWEGYGYGANVYFNNFISGLFKVSTPNIVLGVFGEVREEVPRKVYPISSYGPSLRFFGRNQQDSAFFINLKNTQRKILGTAYEAWNYEVGLVLYLLQGLRAEAAWVFSNKELLAFPSSLADQSGFKIGGGIELGILRISGFFEKTTFTLSNPDITYGKNLNETRRIVQVGITL